MPAPDDQGPCRRPLLWAAAALVALPWSLIAPPVARFQVEAGLALGIVLALSGAAHTGAMEKKLSRLLIQACVVLLGLRMDLHEVARAGLQGLAFAAGTIVGVFALGYALGRALRVDPKTSTLLSTGTAICGGSAIAAVSGVIRATSPQIAVATGTVFILNGVALFVFPALGRSLGLTPAQFGAWAGVAIHDVSSVVGAAQAYAQHLSASLGPDAASQAVDQATIVKLSRVLWIVPICLVAGALARRAGPSDADAKAKPPPIPWFILLFLVAAGVRTALPGLVAPAAPALLTLAKSGMTAALFFIGAGLSAAALRQVGWRALAQGVTLWVAISVASLLVVRATV